MVAFIIEYLVNSSLDVWGGGDICRVTEAKTLGLPLDHAYSPTCELKQGHDRFAFLMPVSSLAAASIRGAAAGKPSIGRSRGRAFASGSSSAAEAGYSMRRRQPIVMGIRP